MRAGAGAGESAGESSFRRSSPSLPVPIVIMNAHHR